MLGSDAREVSMRKLVLVSGSVFCLVAISSLAELNAQAARKEIPLKDIWAYEMPGTKDVRELEPDKFGPSIAKLNTPSKYQSWAHRS